MIGALAIAGMAALSVSTASAWWGGGPWGDRGYNDWNNMSDWLGDGSGDADFGMNMSGRGDSRARGYGYNRYRDYGGYYPPPWAYGPPRGYAPAGAGQVPPGPGTPGAQGPRGPGGPGGWGQQVIKTFESSVDTAIFVSILVGAVAAAVVAWVMTRILTRPVEDIRRTTHSLAQGNYTERVDEPSITELAELAGDVNKLATALEATETTRAQLVSDVAHELRTPLTSINGYVEGTADSIFTYDEMLVAVTDETRRMR
ncbi:MAG: hypothetical protein DSZ00_08050, partial [Gammaproteobacteria bacterium]